jgi:REP element-mobilizing transposase RayT
MTVPREHPAEPLPERRFPHRFEPEKYRVPGQPVGFVLRVGNRSLRLSEAAAAEKLVAAMDTAADDAICCVVAWCVMPDHMHVLAYAGEGGDLITFIDRFRFRSARALRDAGYPTPTWQRSYWDRHVRGSEDLRQLVEYILDNPVRGGLSGRAEDWPYSGVGDYPDGW